MDDTLNKKDYLDIDAIYKIIINLNPIYLSCLEKNDKTFSQNKEKIAMIYETEDTIYNRFLTTEKKSFEHYFLFKSSNNYNFSNRKWR